MTSSATAARDSYLTEVQATTEKAPILKRLVRFAKFLHRLTHHEQQQPSDSPHRTCYGNGGEQRTRTEVQASTEMARVSERVDRFVKLLRYTTYPDLWQLSSSPHSTRHDQLGNCRALQLFDRSPGHH